MTLYRATGVSWIIQMSKDQAITKSTIQLWVIIKPKTWKLLPPSPCSKKNVPSFWIMLNPYWKPEKYTQCSTVEKPKPSKKTKKMEPTWIPATFVLSKGRTQWISAPCGSSSWRQLAPGFCASQGCAGNQGLSFDKRWGARGFEVRCSKNLSWSFLKKPFEMTKIL